MPVAPLHPSLTTMLTTSQNLVQVQQRSLLPNRQDRSVSPMEVREEATTDVGKVVMCPHHLPVAVDAVGGRVVRAVFARERRGATGRDVQERNHAPIL